LSRGAVVEKCKHAAISGRQEGIQALLQPWRAAGHSRWFGTIRNGMVPSVRSSDMSGHKKTPHMPIRMAGPS
jgi:hypothetical protein